MSHDDLLPLRPVPVAGPARPARLSFATLVTVIAGIVLVDAEIIAVAGAAAYALATLVGTGPVGLTLIAVLIGAPALWLCWLVVRLAIAGERAAIEEEQGPRE